MTFDDGKLVPKDKIGGQRFGQLLFNALFEERGYQGTGCIEDRLFFIENKELEKLVKAYLKELQKTLGESDE